MNSEKPRELKVFIEEIKRAVKPRHPQECAKDEFKKIVNDVLLEHNVRDAVEREVNFYWIFLRLKGYDAPITLPGDSKNIERAVSILNAYGLPIPEGLNFILDFFGYEPYSQAWCRLKKDIGKKLGPHSAPARIRKQKKLALEESLGNLPFGQ